MSLDEAVAKLAADLGPDWDGDVLVTVRAGQRYSLAGFLSYVWGWPYWLAYAAMHAEWCGQRYTIPGWAGPAVTRVAARLHTMSCGGPLCGWAGGDRRAGASTVPSTILGWSNVVVVDADQLAAWRDEQRARFAAGVG